MTISRRAQTSTDQDGGLIHESALDDVLALNDLHAVVDPILRWANDNLLTLDVAVQVALILAAFIPAAFFGPRLKSWIISYLSSRTSNALLKRLIRAFAVVATAIALYLTLTIFHIILGGANRPVEIVSAAISLMTAWIVVRLITQTIQSEFWSRVAFYVIWPIAALDAFGFLDDVIVQLEALAIPLGESNDGQTIDISLFDIVRGLFYFGLLFWAASSLGKFLEQRIEKIEELTPSLKALIIKILNIALPTIAFLVALQFVGFNLATLAIFSGAVGLGIGFGLQRIVANFIAGFTLIADRSIKPNDVIEIGNTFGWVTAMEARYVALRTRDGTEHLIPNDTFMAEGVINWSRSDRVIRLHAPFGISYETRDLRFVQQLAIDSAKTIERVIDFPSPACNVIEFGDSSINLDLRFWIRDPANGMANVRSEVYVALWDALMENNIQIPFPQRDLHVKSWPVGEPVDGEISKDTASATSSEGQPEVEKPSKG